MEAWNDKASKWEKAKTVGKAAGKGAANALRDTVDAKDIVKSGPTKGLTKSLGPIGGGLSYYSNYHDARADGLSGKKAHSRAAVDTTLDVAVGGAVQAGSVALFTAIVPIPGVGTAIGVVAGVGANLLLNKKFGKSEKSVMDYTKSAFRKVKNWFN